MHACMHACAGDQAQNACRRSPRTIGLHASAHAHSFTNGPKNPLPQEYARWLRKLAKARKAYAEAYRNEDNETLAAYGYEVRGACAFSNAAWARGALAALRPAAARAAAALEGGVVAAAPSPRKWLGVPARARNPGTKHAPTLTNPRPPLCVQGYVAEGLDLGPTFDPEDVTDHRWARPLCLGKIVYVCASVNVCVCVCVRPICARATTSLQSSMHHCVTP